MSGELKGEWKLLKIWECHKCKALFRDERRVSEHTCEIKENELTISNKIIEKQKGIINDQKVTIEDKDLSIKNQKNAIDSQKAIIDEQKGVINDQKVTIDEQKGVINDQKVTIEDRDLSIKNQKNAIDNQKAIIDEQNMLIKMKEEEDQNKIIEDQKRIIEVHRRAIESQKRTIDDRDILIGDQKRTIETQKKIIRDKEMEEKVVNKNIPKFDETNNGGIHAHVLEKGKPIKDSKEGYREDTEIEIFEKGKGKDRIIIKNGRLTKKPDYIDIIGEYTSEGFVMKGIYKQSITTAGLTSQNGL